MSDSTDFIVVGGGVAGASIAAHLAERASVLLLEMEDQPGYHSTGRSAAVFSESYGNDTIRALTRASRDFFRAPPRSFAAADLLRQRKVLVTATHDQRAVLDAFTAHVADHETIERKTAAEALALLPILRPEMLAGAALSLSTADIDVNELQQGYLRLLKARGGRIATGAEVLGLDFDRDGWSVATRRGTFQGTVVVNAAGAWAGVIGRMAGGSDIGLQPMRRTVCVIDPPADAHSDAWPMLLDAEERFYMKPDAGMLLVSPADETPCAPCDVQADELDVAIAVDRIERATTLKVRRVKHRWAGLRSFVADRSPVVGFDGRVPGLFWFAALGGYGIQTAPALSRLAAALARGEHVPEDICAHGVDAAAVAPERLAVLSDAAA